MGRVSDIISVKSSGLETVGGSSSSFDVSGYQNGSIAVTITAKTGTFTDHRFFIQGSHDGGTTWFGAATGTGLVLVAIVGGAVDIATGTYFAGINFVAPLLRLTWTLAGGTNVTFSSRAAFRK